MGLTAAAIRALKPAEKKYRKVDGRGLYLEVRPNASKLWFYNYRFQGKEKRLSLGGSGSSRTLGTFLEKSRKIEPTCLACTRLVFLTCVRRKY